MPVASQNAPHLGCPPHRPLGRAACAVEAGRGPGGRGALQTPVLAAGRGRASRRNAALLNLSETSPSNVVQTRILTRSPRPQTCVWRPRTERLNVPFSFPLPRLRRPLRASAFLLLATSLLAACQLDKEDDVRSTLGDWMKLGDTYYFYAELHCAAALFDVKASRISSSVSKVRSLDKALRALDQEKPIAFQIAGLSPTQITEGVMNADLPKGLRVLTSGVSGRNCMAEEMEIAYYNALLDPTSVLMMDPVDKFVAVYDRRNTRLFYLRGRDG